MSAIIDPPVFQKQAKTGYYLSTLSRVLLLLLLLLAFFLRIYQLDTQALRGDEAATVLYSALPITDLWELSRITDPHPPLYYLMLHPWQLLSGEGAWAMRFAGGHSQHVGCSRAVQPGSTHPTRTPY